MNLSYQNIYILSRSSIECSHKINICSNMHTSYVRVYTFKHKHRNQSTHRTMAQGWRQWLKQQTVVNVLLYDWLDGAHIRAMKHLSDVCVVRMVSKKSHTCSHYCCCCCCYNYYCDWLSPSSSNFRILSFCVFFFFFSFLLKFHIWACIFFIDFSIFFSLFLLRFISISTKFVFPCEYCLLWL